MAFSFGSTSTAFGLSAPQATAAVLNCTVSAAASTTPATTSPGPRGVDERVSEVSEDTDLEEEKEEERQAAIKAFNKIDTASAGAIDKSRFNELLAAAGIAYADAGHRANDLADASELIRRDKFVEWYLDWIFEEEDWDEEAADEEQEPSTETSTAHPLARFALTEGSWRCEVCTVVSFDANAPECIACGTPNPNCNVKAASVPTVGSQRPVPTSSSAGGSSAQSASSSVPSLFGYRVLSERDVKLSSPSGFSSGSKPPGIGQSDGVEGVVTFPSRVGASYRFELLAEEEKLHIWLEDRKTKKQWCTSQLSVADFAKDDRVIPMASFDDYAKCFLNCLQASSTAQPDFSRDLLTAADVPDGWELKLTLKLRVFTSTWTPTYSFLLKPVPLEPVDLLAAKIRDQEDQIVDLKKQVESLTEKLDDKASAKQPPLVVRGTLGNTHTAGKLVWKADGLHLTGKVVFHATGAIRFSVGGTFVVNIMVQNTNTNNNATVELQVNGKTVVSCMDSNANGHHHVSLIYHVVTVVPEDEILVNYRGNNSAYGGSYIVIHELR